MKSERITVLGAGSGGLSAAYNLALYGFDVTLCELKDEAALGYPWYDTVKKSAFEFSGIPLPPVESLKEFRDMTYTSPDGSIRLSPKKKSNKSFANVNRRYLSSYLVSLCRDAGVKLIFGCRVVSPVLKDGRIAGVNAEINGERTVLEADLFIDSLGLGSTVKKFLPDTCPVERETDDGELFYVTRAEYESSDRNLPESGSNIYLDHCGHTGLDWVTFGTDSVDVLVGFFGKGSPGEVKKAVSDFRRRYPFIKEEIPGTEVSARIPLRKMLPLIVTDNLALIGDSAFMTEPMSGSGISLSLCAGKILADTVKKAGGCYTAEKLWEYNFRYFKEFGRKDLGNHIIRTVLSSLSCSQLDYLFAKKILTEKELAPSSYGKYTVGVIARKAAYLLRRPGLVFALLPAVSGFLRIKKITETVPEEYNVNRIKKWIRLYNKI